MNLTVGSRPAPDWDAYVRAQPGASIYLLSGWSLLAQEVFGHEPYFIEARGPGGELGGVLPLVRQKSLLFGNFATSVPFFNYGGVLSGDDETARLLMVRAGALADELGCSYLELRDTRPRT